MSDYCVKCGTWLFGMGSYDGLCYDCRKKKEEDLELK